MFEFLNRKKNVADSNEYAAFASTKLSLIDKSGKVRHVEVRIFPPRRVDDGDWICEVELPGILSGLNPARGIDSLGALVAALSGLRQVCAREFRGSKIYIRADGDDSIGSDNEVTVRELFGE